MVVLLAAELVQMVRTAFSQPLRLKVAVVVVEDCLHQMAIAAVQVAVVREILLEVPELVEPHRLGRLAMVVEMVGTVPILQVVAAAAQVVLAVMRHKTLVGLLVVAGQIQLLVHL
jgi:hypothetical protein